MERFSIFDKASNRIKPAYFIKTQFISKFKVIIQKKLRNITIE